MVELISTVGASKSNVKAFKSTICPVPFKVNVPLVELIETPFVLVWEVIETPLAPLNVNEPVLVEKFEFVFESKLIEPFTESKLIFPVADSNVIFLLVSTSRPPALANNLIADWLSPCVLVNTIVSDIPLLVVTVKAFASFVLETILIFPPDKLIFLPSEASISIPPASAFNLIDASSVPWVFCKTIVSEEPWLVVTENAFASFVLEAIVIWPPDILISLPAAPSISTPPAKAFNLIDASSVPWVFCKTIVSEEPLLVVTENAFASFVLEAILIWPPDILIFFPAAASISIPPAKAFNSIAASFVPCVFCKTIVSEEPWLVITEKAFASSVLEVILIWPPDILISFPVAASISIPPATEFNWIADSLVPSSFKI